MSDLSVVNSSERHVIVKNTATIIYEDITYNVKNFKFINL